MTTDRIKDLANKGFITQIETLANYSQLSENELIEKGYIAMVGVFDGVDDTTEEVPEEETEVTPAVASNDDDLTPVAPVANDEPEADPDDEPEVEDDDEPEVEPEDE